MHADQNNEITNYRIRDGKRKIAAAVAKRLATMIPADKALKVWEASENARKAQNELREAIYGVADAMLDSMRPYYPKPEQRPTIALPVLPIIR